MSTITVFPLTSEFTAPPFSTASAVATTMAEKRLIFARHGQYQGNVEGFLNTNPLIEYPLTPLGVVQALALGEKLRSENISLIVCSEFLRARQTGAFANKALLVPIEIDSRVNENNIGPELQGKNGRFFSEAIASDPVNCRPPGGESFADVIFRVRELVKALLQRPEPVILIIAHGWVLQAVKASFCGQAPLLAATNEGMPKNCETIELLF